MKRPTDRVQYDIDRHEKEIEQAQELVAAQLDEMMDTVWAEVHEGQHDDELSQSNWLQQDMVIRLARTFAATGEGAILDRKDLLLQIDDYVEDVANMRLTR